MDELAGSVAVTHAHAVCGVHEHHFSDAPLLCARRDNASDGTAFRAISDYSDCRIPNADAVAPHTMDSFNSHLPLWPNRNPASDSHAMGAADFHAYLHSYTLSHPHGDTYADADCDIYYDPDVHGDAIRNTDPHGDAYLDTNADTNPDSHLHTYPDPHANPASNADCHGNTGASYAHGNSNLSLISFNAQSDPDDYAIFRSLSIMFEFRKDPLKADRMRILVLSDIHGNLEALEAVLADAGTWDALWFLGDLVGYGPDPVECIDRIQRLAAIALGWQPRFRCDWSSASRGL